MNLRKSSHHSGRPPENTNYGDVHEYYKWFYEHVVGVESSGLLGYFSSYPHILLEKPFPTNDGFVILELGRGQNEHFTFVAEDFSRYYAIDLVEPKQIPTHPNFEFIESSATNIPLESSSVDRVVATCLLLHLNDPEKALLEMRRVVRPGGMISLYVPPEPSLFLRLFRKLFSQRKASKLGFSGYKLFCVRDHITYFSRIKVLIEYLFRDCSVKIVYRPFFIPSWYLNGLVIFHIRLPIIKN